MFVANSFCTLYSVHNKMRWHRSTPNLNYLWFVLSHLHFFPISHTGFILHGWWVYKCHFGQCQIFCCVSGFFFNLKTKQDRKRKICRKRMKYVFFSWKSIFPFFTSWLTCQKIISKASAFSASEQQTSHFILK